MYLVGTIIGTHGIRGELKVKSETDFNRFVVGNYLFIRKDGKDIRIEISSSRIHKGFYLITIDKKYNINLVLEYVGCNIYTDTKSDDLGEDEFYIDDLVGLTVYNNDKEIIGEVIDVREVPQGYILEVKHNNRVVLIPFVNQFVKEVKEEGIYVELIEGLI